MKLLFLLTSLTWTLALSCMESDETALLYISTAYKNSPFFNDTIVFNCNECSADLMKLAHAANGILSSDIIYNLLESVAVRTQEACCQGFESFATDKKSIMKDADMPVEESEIDLMEDSDVQQDNHFCSWGFFYEPATSCVLPSLAANDSISYPLSYPLMSFDDLLQRSIVLDDKNGFETISSVDEVSLINDARQENVSEAVNIGDDHKNVSSTRKLSLLRSLQVIVTIGVIAVLTLFYVFVISVVIYVWANDYLLDDNHEIDDDARLHELMREIHGKNNGYTALRTKDAFSQTDVEGEAMLLSSLFDECSSEADVTMDDISHSFA